MRFFDCLRACFLTFGILLLNGAVLSQDTYQAEGASELQAASAVVVEATPLAATAAESDTIEPVEHNVLHRPIELSDGLTHWVDRSYPYGSTQQGTYAVHLGVEFVNPRHTPVYSAKSGVVVFAGADDRTKIGPQLDYYGLAVIVAHPIESLAGRQVFTLYGHLERVAVAVGQAVNDLSLLGYVGSSGVALGPHLHFEVRVEDPYDYRMTRNPELWLQHYVDRGMIIGRIRNPAGEPVFGKRVSVRSDSLSRDAYSYEGDIVIPDPVWDENFVVGDLAADDYQVIVLNGDGEPAFVADVTVVAYRTTFVDIVLADA